MVLYEDVELTTISGEKVELIKPLHNGAHCNVYRVKYNGESLVLKWKEKEDFKIDSQYFETIKKLIEQYEVFDEFIGLPIAIVISKNSDNYSNKFGYLMREIPANYHCLNDFFRCETDLKAARFSSYKAQLNAAIMIARFMQKLHMSGYSMNIEPEDILVDDKTGNINIINSEKVSVDMSFGYKFDIRYIAPEIPRSDYKLHTSMETDRYSLAVVLYRLFFIDHPMEGKLFVKYPLITGNVEKYLYSIKPVFHFDPNDESNRPNEVIAPNALNRWEIDNLYTKELRETFIRTFTEGVDNPEKRPSEREWISIFTSIRDKLIVTNENREQFVDFNIRDSIPVGCLMLKVGSKKIAIYPGKEIYEYSVNGNSNGHSNIVGDIVDNGEENCLSLRNLSNYIWRCYSPKTKQLTELRKRQEFLLEPGAAIEFQRENPKIIGEIINPLM